MESDVIIYTVYCFSCITWFCLCSFENCCVVACLNSLLDENALSETVFEANGNETPKNDFKQNWSLSTNKIKHWNSVAKILYSVSIITIQIQLVVQFMSPFYSSGAYLPTHYLTVLVDVTHTCSSSIPCLCLVWLLITQQSILWLLICRLRVLCGPSFASHGSLCRELSWQTCLIDVLGGVSSAIVFLASVQWLHSPALSVPLMWIPMCQIHCTAGRKGSYGTIRISVTYEQ